MEGLACTYTLCIELRYGIERGESVSAIIKNCANEIKPDLSQELRKLAHHFEQYGSLQSYRPAAASLYRNALFQLIGSALSGEPVLKKLIELEKEIKLACEEDVEKFISSLPVKIMLPILLMQFPAFLLLLLGPIVSQYLKGLSL